MAVSPEEGLRDRFVEEALRRPAWTRQLKERMAFALHAAVGLDSRRRARVEQLLGQELRKEGITPEQQVDVALTLSRFEIRDPAVMGSAAQVLAQAISNTTDYDALRELVHGLSALTARMEPKQAVGVLTQAMTKTTNPGALRSLAQGLSAVAARMEPKQAAAILAQTMTETTDSDALGELAEGLSVVAARLEPKEAAAVCSQTADILARAVSKTTDFYALSDLTAGLSAVATGMGPKEARQATASLARAMSKITAAGTLGRLAEGLSAVLTGGPLYGHRRHATVAATAVGLGAHSRTTLSALSLFAPAVLSPPCRLSDQQLVDLLKHPLFVGEARRVLLDLLGDRHGRRFADQWEFVEFAQERRLGLDFTSPPTRLEPIAPTTPPRPGRP
ncbi:MAG: hypothetical protein HYS12_26375 [Planctomycetes bacterium]|nr:hypothetical protein [Planctomycetota bacterium]